MTHDPFQNYQTLGAYSAGATPFGLPYAAFQQGLNPGIGGYSPLHAQLGLLQQLTAINPLTATLQNPLLHNPLLQNPLLQSPLLQNPLLQHALAQAQWQNPQINPQFAPQQFGAQPFGQQQLGPQFNPQFNPMLAYQAWPQQGLSNYPLAPQSLIGAGAIGQPYGQISYGQINPLAQFGIRPTHGYGFAPMGCI